MKVVINKCYGGFGLSIEAQKLIAEIGCPHSKWEDEAEYFKTDNTEENKAHHAEFCEMFRKDGKILIDEHNWKYEDASTRACPVLLKVVKKLGNKANGHHANLKIVKIPDGIRWEINEYDGIEWIDEKHRSWG